MCHSKKIQFHLLLLVFVTTHVCYGQGITKTQDDEGTILFRGNSVAFDVGEAEFSANINNIKSVLGLEHAVIYGAQLKGKSADGIGNIFDGGSFVPSATASVYFGYSRAWGIPKNYRAEFSALLKSWKEEEDSFAARWRADLNAVLKKGNASKAKLASYIDQYIDVYELEEIIGMLENYDPGADALSTNLRKILLTHARGQLEEYKEGKNRRVKLIAKYGNVAQSGIDTDTTYKQLFLFAFGGFEGSEFQRYSEINTTDFSSSFSPEHFRGGWGGLGVNFQCDNWMFGLTWTRRETNNFDLLSKSSFTLRTQHVAGNQTLTKESQITAYSGEYGEPLINELKFDLVYRFILDPEEDFQMLLNGYLNSQYNSTSIELLPNSTNVGTGFYFFNKKNAFLGGLYVELPDVNNNYERLKPPDDQAFRKPLKKLTFGVVGKVSIASLMNTF